MKHYIEELKRQLHEIMGCPATLGRAEEVMVYADAICALRRMEGHDEAEGFTEDDAKAWTARMENEDGTTGPHGERGRHDRPALDDGSDGRRGQYHRCQREVLRLVGGDEHDVLGLLRRSCQVRP